MTDATESVEADASLTAEKGAVEHYPIDSLLIRSETRSVVDVIRRIQKKTFVLDPEFQRDFLWDEYLQSRLVESVLMRIPLPVFYIAESKSGSLIVVDGLQRLTTLSRFYAGELTLSLPDNPELNGLVYSTLPQRLRDRFEDGQLVFFIVDPKVPERVRLDIFERVNSGRPLTRQQMRNAIYSGDATKLLKELAMSTDFREATGGALSSDTHRKEMDDREAINRVIAFMLVGWKSYTKTITYDEFLGSTLAKLNARAEKDPSWLAKLRGAFLRSMRINRALFGRHAFRKFALNEERQRPLNLALLDTLGSTLSVYDEAKAISKGKLLKKGLANLMKDSDFMTAISRGTLWHDNVRTRFSGVSDLVLDTLGEPSNVDYLVPEQG